VKQSLAGPAEQKVTSFDPITTGQDGAAAVSAPAGNRNASA
jgi:hypothetical protein